MGKKDEGGSLGGKVVGGIGKGVGKVAVGTTKVAVKTTAGVTGGVATGVVDALTGDDSDEELDLDAIEAEYGVDDDVIVVPEYGEKSSGLGALPGVGDTAGPPIKIGGVEIPRGMALVGLLAFVVLSVTVAATYMVLNSVGEPDDPADVMDP